MRLPNRFICMNLTLAALVLVSSSSGIFVNGIYARETTDWALRGIAQDVTNIVAIIVLTISAYWVNRGSFRGLLLSVGVLLFLIYAYVIYAFDIHYNQLFLLYVAILGLAIYTFLDGAIRLDNESERRKHFPTETKTWTVVSAYLMGLALLFYFIWLSQDLPALLTDSVPINVIEAGLPTNPVHVLDLGIYLPAVILTSISLWKRRRLGFAFAAPLLVFLTLTGLGILTIDYLTGSGISGQVAFITSLTVSSLVLSWLFMRHVTE